MDHDDNEGKKLHTTIKQSMGEREGGDGGDDERRTTTTKGQRRGAAHG